MSDNEFRPTSFEHFRGQPKLKQKLKVKISSSLVRQKPLEHMLFNGPPGSGKTTLAGVIASELDIPFLSFIMPWKNGVLPKLVSNFEGIAFFDELHRLTAKQQEELLPLIEDGYIQLSSGKRIYTDNLTILAATTERNQIIKPLLDRFFTPSFEEYSVEDMTAIALDTAAQEEVYMPLETAEILGQAGAGVPRKVKHLVYMYRDLWYTYSEYPSAEEVLEAAGVTRDGLTEDHLQYLSILKKLGGISGINILSTQLDLDKSSVEELEQLLIKKNYILPTKSGRELQTKGYEAAGDSFDFI